MNKSRTDYAIINSSVSAVIFFINTILKFIGRSVFIYFLGKAYLGVNSLFTSIIGILSLSELGIGPAIVYSLYKPLAQDDHIKVKSLMVIYKKIYIIIGVIVTVLGVGLLPFIPNIVGKTNIPNIIWIYLLFLCNSVVSYFFSYNRSLLSADQKNYLITINDFIFSTITQVLQMVILWKTKNFILYLLVAIFFSVLGNIYLKRRVDKEYSFLSGISPQKLDNETKKELRQNTLGNLIGKIGIVVVMTTDNIYISLFSGVVNVGLYNNYMLAINAANSLISQINNSLTGSLGNLSVTENGNKSYQVFRKNHFINYFITSIFIISFVYLLNDFIYLWLGKGCQLPTITIFLIIINYMLLTYRNVVTSFNVAYGLTYHLRWKVFFECGANILFSAFFLIILKLGLNGVILGTIFSTIFVVEWWEPYVLFKYGFKKSFIQFIPCVIRQVISLIVVIIMVGILLPSFKVYFWWQLILKAIIVLVLSIVFLSFLFWNSEEMKYMRKLIFSLLSKLK